MALDNVLKGIRQRGKRRAEEIRKEAKEEAERILAEARKEAEEKREQARQRAVEDAEPLRKQEVLGAEIEAKKMRLDAERRAMEAVKDRARKRLNDLPDQDRADLLEALVARARDELGSPRIFAATADADLVEGIAGEAFAGTRSIGGGIVAESKDGTVLVDYSFDTLLDEVWQEATRDVAEVLRK